MNYLPFVRRSIITVPAFPARRAVSLASMSMGPGRSILQDFSVSVSGAVNFYEPNDTSPLGQTKRSKLFMRYGWEKHGYLTEDFHPVGAFLSMGRTLTPLWKFERPYRLDPGEEIKATLTAGGDYNLASMPAESSPAFVFNGLRTKDNQPKLLYDVSRTVDATGTILSLSTTCDSDSSILLYSMAIDDWWDYNDSGNLATVPRTTSLQVFGPGGREWFHYEADFTLSAAQLQAFTGYWVNHDTDYIRLGEDMGWVQESDESFIVEYRQPEDDLASKVVVTTLRGFLERPND